MPINQNQEVRSVGVHFSFFLKKKKSKKKANRGVGEADTAIRVHWNMLVRVCSDSEALLAKIRGLLPRWNETTL